VIFLVVMIVWLLSNLGGIPAIAQNPWLPWIACVVLGAALFVFGYSTIGH